MAIHVVTGAFGYSGKYITERLLSRGHAVKTLTNSPKRPNPFGNDVQVEAYNFDHQEELEKSLFGASVLYNTYWVRFNYDFFSHQDAVANTLKLFSAAKNAGVKRVVHVSITNPDVDSPLEYFSGKAKLEQALRETEIPHSILRPAVLFGHEDILVNNIAWTLRRFPIFGVFGDGEYRIQPIHVEDFADLAVREGESTGVSTINAIGPETFTYRELVLTIAKAICKERPIVSVGPSLGYLLSRVIGFFVGDIFVTREEIAGLMADLLCVEKAEPQGKVLLSDWVKEHSSTLGTKYASELGRRKHRDKAYSAV